MKKVLSILILVLSIQSINAHVSSSHHTHDSILGEWAWILLPCIALCVLAWKLRGKYDFKALKNKIFNQ